MVSVDVLGSSELFRELDAHQLEQIAGLASLKEYASGISLFRQNQRISSLYVVQEGSVRLSMDVRIWERGATLNSVVGIMEQGGTFGWPALVEPNVATFSAETIGRCEMIEIQADHLRELLDTDHSLGYNVMSRLANLIAERLRSTQEAMQRFRAEDLREHI